MMLDRLKDQGTDDNAGEPKETGSWFPIRFKPDAVTGELLNLGVGFISLDGSVHTRMLERFDGIKCLYQDRLREADVAFLIRAVEQALPRQIQDHEPLTAPSPQVIFGERQPAAGRSAAEVLESLYSQMVTLGNRAAAVEEREKPDQLPTEKARQTVFNAMRRRSYLADRIIAENAEWPVGERDKTGRKRVLNMPLRGAQRFGTVVSAVYKGDMTRRVHLYSAVMDLEAALTIHPGDHAGVFVIRPSQGQRGYDEPTLVQIDNDLDQLAWQLGLHKNVRFDSEEDTETLAEHILDWAGVA